MTFDLYPLRFSFVAREAIRFPGVLPGNVLRGALGTILKREPELCRRIFEPPAPTGAPSGLSDPPRPFVFRARELEGANLRPGAPFHFDFHLFDVSDPPLTSLARAFAEIGRAGIGPGRGRAELTGVFQIEPEKPIERGEAPVPLVLHLDRVEPAQRVRVQFKTPTEIKGPDGPAGEPQFATLIARIRDRLSTLRSLYGSGPLEIDFRGLAERASVIRMTRCEVRHVDFERRSSRTGETHPMGGFTGFAEYDGPLGEFLPYLRAAAWTGVGRQTTWGKGEIEVEVAIS